MTRAQVVALARHRRRHTPKPVVLPDWFASKQFSGSAERFWKGLMDEMLDDMLAAPDLASFAHKELP